MPMAKRMRLKLPMWSSIVMKVPLMPNHLSKHFFNRFMTKKVFKLVKLALLKGMNYWPQIKNCHKYLPSQIITKVSNPMVSHPRAYQPSLPLAGSSVEVEDSFFDMKCCLTLSRS